MFTCYTPKMTITQTVEIPENRRLTIEMPREVPSGKASIEVKVFPFVKKEERPADNRKIRFTREELDEMVKNSPTLHKLSGILHTDMTLDEIRMARLAKHL